MFFRIIIVLIAMVIVKWPMEGCLNDAHLRLGLENTALSIRLREKMSQNLAVALLSGFRGVVADFVWLDAHRGWEDGVWYKLREGIELAVLLQPHSISFWDIGAWHMAWNASYGASKDPGLPNDATRIKTQREWILEGRHFLEEGIRNNPGSYDLHFKLGWLINQKLKDPLAAAEEFRIAASYPDAPLFVPRMVGHMLVNAGDYRRAYEWWKRMWAQDHQKTPDQLWRKIAQWGAEAEEKLNVPREQRIFPSQKK